MNCQEFLTRIEVVALDGPDMQLPSELYEHQLDCVACNHEYQTLQEAWMLLPAALEKEPIRPDFEAKVMTRIESTPNDPEPSESQEAGFFKYAFAATVLIALVGGTMWVLRWMDSHSTAEDDLNRVKEIASQVDKLEQLEDAFANPELRYVSLTSTGVKKSVLGFLVYDSVAHEGHFFVYGLDRAEKQTCVLWLLNAKREVVVSATIDVGPDGIGSTIIPLPEDTSELYEVVVSFEKDETSASPSADVRMRAAIDL